MNEKELKQWIDEGEEIIAELLNDGSDPDATYRIEHHLSCNNFDRLEKGAVTAFKQGFEVSDAQEMELDDGSLIFCFDIIKESPLDATLINQDVRQILELTEKLKLNYDGWGTYFEGDEEEGEEESDED